jgi:hypothetical protein
MGTLSDETRKGTVLKFEKQQHPYDTFIIETEIKFEFWSGHGSGHNGKNILLFMQSWNSNYKQFFDYNSVA